MNDIERAVQKYSEEHGGQKGWVEYRELHKEHYMEYQKAYREKHRAELAQKMRERRRREKEWRQG